MNNSVSEQSFYIDSDEESAKDYDVSEFSDNDNSSNDGEDQRQESSRPPSVGAWPKSYGPSMDQYSSVGSPSINFLATSSIARLGSALLSSSHTLTRRHTPEVLPSLSKPLIPQVEDVDKPQERRSSHALLPPLPSRKSSVRKDVIKSSVSHGPPLSRRSSCGQAVINGMNVLCGVGLLSTSYAAEQGGWAGLAILFIFAILSYYTGILLRACLDSKPGLETYPDIGEAAFGGTGRIAISIILYIELYACCVEYIILESDNLSSLFPNAHLNLGLYNLNAKQLFALITTFAVLPTTWLKDLSVLSYISFGGVIASVLVVACLLWVGVVDGVGFEAQGTKTLNLSTLPVAIGLYGYCYSGHAVFPNIYKSMEKPTQYPSVLFVSFGICTVLYAAVAIMGYKMFGAATQSQFTLNMPKHLVASQVALWTTVVNPFTKYALTMAPVACCLEELLPAQKAESRWSSILIRSALVLSTLVVGLSIPFFGLVMALIGSLLTMLVTFILPCACYLSINRGKITLAQGTACTVVITVGVVCAVFGSYSALSAIVANLAG